MFSYKNGTKFHIHVSLFCTYHFIVSQFSICFLCSFLMCLPKVSQPQLVPDTLSLFSLSYCTGKWLYGYQLSPFLNLDETHLVCRFCLPDWLKKEPRTQLRSLEELTPCPEGYTLTSCKKKTWVKRSPKFFLKSFLRWPIPRYSFRTVCLKAVASAVTSLCFSSFYALLVMTSWLHLPIRIST